jgi:chemotaxis methyl-accepting protein methylase
MLQDTRTIRNYQKLTDSLVDMWERGYRPDELRLFLDGYLAALRTTNAMEAHLIHRLEEESTRFLYDPSNFNTLNSGALQTELERER